jgi:RNA-directed DNA polymerase
VKVRNLDRGSVAAGLRLEPLGLLLSPAKTQIVHMSEGFDLLGFHIRWRASEEPASGYVYTYVAKRPIRSVRDTIGALTPRTSQQDLGTVLIRINQITRGWTNYFKHAVAKHTFSHLRQFTWWRIVQMMRTPARLEVEGRPPVAHRPRRPVVA